jgi:hypothetical protein
VLEGERENVTESMFVPPQSSRIEILPHNVTVFKYKTYKEVIKVI